MALARLPKVRDGGAMAIMLICCALVKISTRVDGRASCRAAGARAVLEAAVVLLTAGEARGVRRALKRL